MESLKVVKRDGKLVDFDFRRIALAVTNAYEDCYGEDFYEFDVEIEEVFDNIYDEILLTPDDYISVEEIQNIVVDELIKINKIVGKAYNEYRSDLRKEILKGEKSISFDELENNSTISEILQKLDEEDRKQIKFISKLQASCFVRPSATTVCSKLFHPYF